MMMAVWFCCVGNCVCSFRTSEISSTTRESNAGNLNANLTEKAGIIHINFIELFGVSITDSILDAVLNFTWKILAKAYIHVLYETEIIDRPVGTIEKRQN